MRLAALAEQAARLCKADLVTEMVGEFPELQGVMGSYYARAEGLPTEVADAIRDHYKPVGQGDEVPTAPVTVAVSLADKLDTLVAFYSDDENWMRPTGSRDPFALRRAAVGIIKLLSTNGLRLPLRTLLGQAYIALVGRKDTSHKGATLVAYFVEDLDQDILSLDGIDDPVRVEKFNTRDGWRDRKVELAPDVYEDGSVQDPTYVYYGFGFHPFFVVSDALLDFLADRLKVQQREAGVRHDLIDAVFALGGEDDLVRLLARVHALQAFVGTTDGVNLLAGYKRAANILKKENYEPGESDAPSYAPEPAESALIAALDLAEPLVKRAIAAEDFAAAMTALASLRGPIDAFFGEVMVNDPDPAKRAARLALLDRFRSAVHRVADFSKIEG